MATFWSFDQSSLHKLMGTEQRNQEMDVIIILDRQRKFIIIEVKSDQSGKIPANALTTLKNAETFAHQVFKILGIEESEHWEFIPLVALPNVVSREKLDREYRSKSNHILTKTEIKSDLSKVIQLTENEYEDLSSYKTILGSLAASYHATAVKKESIGAVQFEIKNLVLEASRKLAGEAQIQPGFDVSEEIKDIVSFTDLKNAPLAGFRGFMFWNKGQIDILQRMEEHEELGTPCVVAGVWGTGKTLLLAYKAIKLSNENKKVVFISNLDWADNKVDKRHYVYEEKMRIDFLKCNTNISFYTMKDIIKDLEGKFPRIQRCKRSLLQFNRRRMVGTRLYQSLLLRFIKKVIRTGTYHILVDEVEYEKEEEEEHYSRSFLEELQAVRLKTGSLTVALRGETIQKDIKENPLVLNKVMRMSTRVYETITDPEAIPDYEIFPRHRENLYLNNSVQNTVLGCKPELILVTSSHEMISTGLKEALPKVDSHPFVVVLLNYPYLPLYLGYYNPDYELKDEIIGAVEVIRANTNKQVHVFGGCGGCTSQLEELRALLRNPEPSGFLVTTSTLYSGMEATSVIVIDGNRGCHGPSYNNGLFRATTSLIYIEKKDGQ